MGLSTVLWVMDHGTVLMGHGTVLWVMGHGTVLWVMVRKREVVVPAASFGQAAVGETVLWVMVGCYGYGAVGFGSW